MKKEGDLVHMRNRLFFIFIVGFFQSSLVLGASGTGTSTVEFLSQPVAVSQSSALNFGQVIPTLAGGTIAVSATTGAISNITGSSTFIGSSGVSRGSFTITGQPSYTVSITPGSNATLTGPGGNITLSTITVDSTSKTLNASGAATVYVGARVVFPASITPGTYSGNYSITVNY
ncbi:MAG: DUF4402 domain-containing protein [Alphaproteobacteria bacterium]|nr:DUF4402 domain-containing protein [Alphaproteobacteria bacterium]